MDDRRRFGSGSEDGEGGMRPSGIEMMGFAYDARPFTLTCSRGFRTPIAGRRWGLVVMVGLWMDRGGAAEEEAGWE